jgi:hypothetical protein
MATRAGSEAQFKLVSLMVPPLSTRAIDSRSTNNKHIAAEHLPRLTPGAPPGCAICCSCSTVFAIYSSRNPAFLHSWHRSLV